MIGDLNEVVTEEEKWGGRNIWKKRLYLKEFVNNLGALDLGFKGHRYTWSNRQNVNGLIKECLDRTIANKDWIEVYPNAEVEHLMSDDSYHSPIILRTEKMKTRANHPFRFLEA